MRVSSRAEDPQWYQDTDETSDMEAEDHTLDQRKMLGQEGVEEGHEQNNGNGDQCPVPPFVDVAVVVQDNESLDLGRSEKASYGHTALPAEGTKPAHSEGEDLLVFSGREFGNPVILSTWSDCQ